MGLKKTSNFLQGIALSVSELFRAMIARRHRRLLPLLPVLLIVALMLAIVSSSGVLAPFVYPLF